MHFFGQAVFRTAGLWGSLGEGRVRILEVFDSMRILVSGAVGKMGQEVCKAIQGAEGFELVGGVDISGKTLPGVTMFNDLGEAIDQLSPHVVVDFTTPQAVEENMEICFAKNVPLVIVTTGMSEDSLGGNKEIGKQSLRLILPSEPF